MQLFVRLPRGVRELDVCESETVMSAISRAAVDSPSTSGRSDERVVCNGRTLDPWSSLAVAGVCSGAMLECVPRLRGGGGDGGSTGAESRSCYLEMYLGKKPDKVNPEEERLARWTTCQLSGMALAPPCVADELGNLFNKDAVIQALVNKSIPASLSHISSLKHVVDLQLHEDPTAANGSRAGRATNARDGGAAAESVRFSCPVTGQPMGGKGRFVAFLRRGGHVVSERALKEVPAVVEELVGGKWTQEDLLQLAPAPEELHDLRLALLARREAARAAKKEKRGAKANKAAAAADVGSAEGEGTVAHSGAKRPASVTGDIAAGGAGAAAAAAAALYGGEAARNGSAPAGAAGKKFKASELKPVGADEKVWSSIFTSSRGDQGPRNDYLVRGSTRMATAG